MIRLLALVAACGAAAPPPQTLPIDASRDVQLAVVEDYVTVVDFWAEWCGACFVMADKLAAAIAHEPRVLVRKVDIGDGQTLAAKTANVGALPHMNVYDKHKRLRFILVGNDCERAGELAKRLLGER